MEKAVFGAKIKGATHTRTGAECQDSFGIYKLKDDAYLIAVADGHGSSSSPYSRDGSKRAVQAFFKVLKPLYDSYAVHLEQLMTYLNREGSTKVAQNVCAEWREKVALCHSAYGRPFPLLQDNAVDTSKLIKQYGTTLLGMLFTNTFMFIFQIGDGDIGYVDTNGYNLLVEPEKILGVETHSLSHIDAWKNSVTAVHRINEAAKIPYAIIINTDGLSNSYSSDEQFRNACIGYFDALNLHGVDAVRNNLRAWLKETSQQGCGDDITMVIAYHYC